MAPRLVPEPRAVAASALEGRGVGRKVGGAGVTAMHPRFAEVYEASFAFVWRSARHLGAPEAIIDDVVQEIFVIVHQRLVTFEGRSSVRTWLFGIVRNVVRAHRRGLLARHPASIRADARTDTDALVCPAEGPHEQAARTEATRLVDRLLDSLDDDRREVFVLAELEQLSSPAIAAMLKVPLNTVSSRLRLARQDFAAAAARHRARDEWRTR